MSYLCPLVAITFLLLSGCGDSDTEQAPPGVMQTDPDVSSPADVGVPDTADRADTAASPDTAAETDTQIDTRPSDTGSMHTTDTTDVFEPDAPADAAIDFPTWIRVPWTPSAVASSVTFNVIDQSGEGTFGGLDIRVPAPFELTGDLGPLNPGETRQLQIQLPASAASTALWQQAGSWTVDEHAGEFIITASSGNSLPSDLGWQSVDNLSLGLGDFSTAPFPHGSARYTDSSVVIAVPQGLRARDPVDVVLHFHGHNADVDMTVERQQLLRLFARSGRNAVFVAPQGPLLAADGNFGRLTEVDGVRALLADVISTLYRERLIDRPQLGRVVVTAHSGGYRGTADTLDVGGVDVAGVHLFDALYGRLASYERYGLSGGVIRSMYTTGGGTGAENLALLDRLEGSGVAVAERFDDESLSSFPALIAPVPWSHGDCIWAERAYARWLTHSALPPHSQHPPELRQVVATNGEARVVWRADTLSRDERYVVQTFDAGWSDAVVTEQASATVPLSPRIRVVRRGPAGDSAPGDEYGATGAQWLVVDGFDRVIDGSYRQDTHNFAALVGAALPDFSVASNEAVASGGVDLESFDGVLWLLGDESTYDVTFDVDEQAALESYIATGRPLIVSGSEVGYATESDWLASALGVSYVSDDAGTNRAGGLEFGVTYDEDYPDVLAGDTTVWRYDTGGAAAVMSDNVIVVGFPLETLAPADLRSAVDELLVALNAM